VLDTTPGRAGPDDWLGTTWEWWSAVLAFDREPQAGWTKHATFAEMPAKTHHSLSACDNSVPDTPCKLANT
jgi:hypothetical protein